MEKRDGGETRRFVFSERELRKKTKESSRFSDKVYDIVERRGMNMEVQIIANSTSGQIPGTVGKMEGSGATQSESEKDTGRIPKRVEFDQPEEQPLKTVTKEEVEAMLERANRKLAAYDRRFEVSVHQRTRRIMVKVIDTMSDKVIREVPSERMLDALGALFDLAGIFVDKKV